ncbi:hypothetical protein, partial [Puia sp.]|uniref:hypothetical protein n=1 Tax=Puia sp. TaxID=2045100 RepID=UPI002F4213BD
MKPFALVFTLTASIVFYSCHKDSSNSSSGNTPPPTNTTGTMKISLAMPADTAVKNCELIISETGGKVLLDTVTSRGTTVGASLSTNATLVDVTLVEQHQYPQSGYYVYTYKAV